MIDTGQINEAVVLRPEDLRAVYAISLAIAQSENIDSAMDLIVQHTRPVFIFDNLVLFLPNEQQRLEPSYARVVGRGKYAEGEIEWGDAIAQQAYTSQLTSLVREKIEGWETNRLFQRDFLGLPLKAGDEILGVLVFGRFGGPPYTADQIRLAEFIAAQTTQLVENHKLVGKVAKLEAERKLRVMQDDFITNISHEIRTPIGFIKGYATTLLRDDIVWDDHTRREFLTIIDEEADRMNTLINDMLDSSQLKAGTMRMQCKPVGLQGLINDIVNRNVNRYHEISIQFQPDCDPIALVDSNRIAQVLNNLFNNAAKYAPGSTVCITLSMEGDYCKITIADNGPGIGREHLEHLCERFYCVPGDNAHGTGLGLYICNEIIRAHGGYFSVESELSKGTAFTIHLPYKTLDPQPTTVREE